MQPRLVGRAEELDRLGALVRAVTAGHGGSAFIVGDAGIGKSALVSALLTTPGDAVTAVGVCSPGGAASPFAPWLEVLAGLDHAAVALGVELPVGVRRVLVPLLQPWDVTADGGLGQPALFAAITELVMRVAAARSVLLAFEDAHWADLSSLDLLAHVARRASRAAVGVIVTSRPLGAPTGDGGARARQLQELVRSASVLVPLGPLCDDDVAAVVRDAASAVAPGVDVVDLASIVRLADGNPFLALHLLRRGPAATGPDDADVLGVRRATADPEVARLLVRLALAVDSVDTEVATAAAMPADRFAELGRQLVDDGLLVVDAGQLRFRHALIREQVAALATPAETRSAHGDLVDAMVGTAHDRRAATLAHHQITAGRFGDGLRSLLRAADHADRVHGYREAQDALVAAREIWSRVRDPERMTGMSRAGLLRRLGRTARSRGDFAVAREAWDELERGAHDPVELGYDRALTHYLDGDEFAAVAQLERAQAQTGPEGHPLRGRILTALAQALLSCWAGERAVAVAAAAAEAEAADDPAVRLHARISGAMASLQTGAPDPPVAVELRACVTEARSLGGVEVVLRGYAGLLYVLLLAADFARVITVADEAAAACVPFGPQPTLTSIVTPFRVEALRALGRFDAAWAVADGAVDDAMFREVAMVLHAQIAGIAAVRGDWEDVARRVDATSGSRAADTVLIAMRLDARVRLALHRGQVATAVDDVRATLAGWPLVGSAIATVSVYRTGWRVLAEVTSGADDVAGRLDDLLASVPAERIERHRRTQVLRDLGLAERARARRDPDEVLQWATVITALQGLGWRDESAWAQVRHAEALARTRQLADAGRAAHAARASAEAIGAGAVREASDRLLTLLGDPAAPATASPDRRWD